MALKKNIQKYIKDKIGISGLEEKLSTQIDYLSALVQVGLSEEITLDSDIKKELDLELKEKFGIENVNYIIHKNDLMFHYHLNFNTSNLYLAFRSYFNLGLEFSQGLNKLIESRDWNSSKILDFGSGYGRISRFYPAFIKNSQIYVSEVKPMALEFQEKHFGFQKVNHGHDSNSISDTQYDLITASSVFTHLNETLFEEWFIKLYDLLEPNGHLLASYNDESRLTQKSSSGIQFSQKSEDSAYYSSDKLKDTSKYGLTYVSKEYLYKLAKKHSIEIELMDNFYGDRQQFFILSK